MSAAQRLPEPIDFDLYHRETLPALIAAGRGSLAADTVRSLGSLAFRRREGGAYTYVPTAGGVEVREGDESADTVIELSHDFWQGIVQEFEGAAGLLYGGQVKCLRGNAIRWIDWEPALRTLYNGRPIYDPEHVNLRDRAGQPVDPELTFTLDDDPEDLAQFLRSAGYLFVRGVFAADEVATMRAEAEILRTEARKGDQLSWWAKNARGEEVLSRVTRAASQPKLRTIPSDPRLLRLKDLADEPLVHRGGGDEGVSVIWKNPGVIEGLSDLPWHRDCGMGGHAVMCPVLIASTFLTPSNPQTGELKMLPGSWQAACGPIDATHPRAPRGASFAAQPGDVSLHYGDTMHAAPPPQGEEPECGYRISAVTGYTRPGARHHRGGKHYNEVLHGRADGQIEHLAAVVAKAGPE